MIEHILMLIFYTATLRLQKLLQMPWRGVSRAFNRNLSTDGAHLFPIPCVGFSSFFLRQETWQFMSTAVLCDLWLQMSQMTENQLDTGRFALL